jgi:hypothetical protein
MTVIYALSLVLCFVGGFTAFFLAEEGRFVAAIAAFVAPILLSTAIGCAL